MSPMDPLMVEFFSISVKLERLILIDASGLYFSLAAGALLANDKLFMIELSMLRRNKYFIMGVDFHYTEQ